MASSNFLAPAALRVGVTGHRHLDAKLAEELRPRVSTSLRTIRSALQSVASSSIEAYQKGPVLLRAISPLAEGADRLFAQEALLLDYKLDCPLPFDVGTYYETFEGGPDGVEAAKEDPPTDESIEKLRQAKAQSIHDFEDLFVQRESAFVMEGASVPAGLAYEAVGRVVLDQSDMLLAIWDGQPAGGEGGTANIVKLARSRNMPVLLLRADMPLDTLLLHGSPHDGAALKTEVIEAVVRSLAMPPWGENASENSSGAYTGSQMGGQSLLGRIWDTFEALLTVGIEYPPEAAAPDTEVQSTDEFEPYYRGINQPAKRLAGLYRGAFLINYGLGVLAVFLALLSYTTPELSRWWVLEELVAIVTVLVIAQSIRHSQWHHRSVDCRYLAEQVRILRHVYPLALSVPMVRLPKHYVQSDQKTWMEWRLRAIVWQLPMPARVVTPPDVEASYSAIQKAWIADQIHYHERNQCRLELMDHRLHRLGEAFIYIAFIGCLGHLFFHEPPIAPWLTLLAAGFPAAAAACHAISTQGEFRRLADRSEAMAQSLRNVSKQLETLKTQGRLSGAVLREEVNEVARVMLEEVVDWQILYRKPAPPVG